VLNSHGLYITTNLPLYTLGVTEKAKMFKVLLSYLKEAGKEKKIGEKNRLVLLC
jgi:hypothetical protein